MTEEVSFEKVGDYLIDGAGNVWKMADSAVDAIIDGANALGGFIGDTIAALMEPMTWVLIGVAIVAVVIVVVMIKK